MKQKSWAPRVEIYCTGCHRMVAAVVVRGLACKPYPHYRFRGAEIPQHPATPFYPAEDTHVASDNPHTRPCAGPDELLPGGALIGHGMEDPDAAFYVAPAYSPPRRGVVQSVMERAWRF